MMGILIKTCLISIIWHCITGYELRKYNLQSCWNLQLDNGYITHLTRSRVVFSCNPRYFLVGRNTATCVRGSLRSEMPICVRNECLSLKLQHGNVMQRRRDVFRFNCNTPYILIGPRTVYCHNGTASAMPVCAEPGCNSFKSFNHGTVTYLYEKALAKTTCYDGFSVVGSETLYCTNNAWNDTAPICVANSIKEFEICDFEKKTDGCKWIFKNGFYNWTIRSTPVLPNETMRYPPTDHTKGPHERDGHYVYLSLVVPMAGRTSIDVHRTENSAKLISPYYPPTLYGNDETCVIFWYYSNGLHVGKISVHINDNTVWESKISYGNRWLKKIISLQEQSHPFQIQIRGLGEMGYYSNTAIDDLKVTTGSECHSVDKNVLDYPMDFDSVKTTVSSTTITSTTDKQPTTGRSQILGKNLSVTTSFRDFSIDNAEKGITETQINVTKLWTPTSLFFVTPKVLSIQTLLPSEINITSVNIEIESTSDKVTNGKFSTNLSSENEGDISFNVRNETEITSETGMAEESSVSATESNSLPNLDILTQTEPNINNSEMSDTIFPREQESSTYYSIKDEYEGATSQQTYSTYNTNGNSNFTRLGTKSTHAKVNVALKHFYDSADQNDVKNQRIKKTEFKTISTAIPFASANEINRKHAVEKVVLYAVMIIGLVLTTLLLWTWKKISNKRNKYHANNSCESTSLQYLQNNRFELSAQ